MLSTERKTSNTPTASVIGQSNGQSNGSTSCTDNAGSIELANCLSRLLVFESFVACSASIEGDGKSKVNKSILVLNEVANAEITQHGDDLLIELNLPCGILKLLQTMEYGEYVLQGTLNDVEFSAGKWTTLDLLQAHVKEQFSEYEKFLINKEINDRAATMLQRFVRSYNVVGVKEFKGDIPAIRAGDGTVLAHQLSRNRWIALVTQQEYEKKYKSREEQPLTDHLVEPLPEIADRTRVGAFKVLTHETDRYVGFTLKNWNLQTLNPEIVDIIRQNNLDKIVPQIRLNQYQMVAPNLGKKDMFDELVEGYTFCPAHFKELAVQISKLHSLGIVHRDVKPENLFLVRGHAYLTDTDSMRFVRDLVDKPIFGTLAYASPVFFQHCFTENVDERSLLNVYKREQFSFFCTLITFYARANMPPGGSFDPWLVINFVECMTSDKALQVELFCFLLEPDTQQLTQPWENYFE